MASPPVLFHCGREFTLLRQSDRHSEYDLGQRLDVLFLLGQAHMNTRSTRITKRAMVCDFMSPPLFVGVERSSFVGHITGHVLKCQQCHHQGRLVVVCGIYII